MRLTRMAHALSLVALAGLLAACAGRGGARPIEPVAHVDLDRFMGDWYVIASIPTPFERGAYNAVESYALEQDGRIGTVFRYRKDGFEGGLQTMTPTGFVREGTGNAVWGMQFVWPIKAEYVIADLDPEYRWTLIGRSKRDYLWIMARTPTLPTAEYDALVAKAKALGYDTSKLRKVPQQWPETAADARR